MMLCLWRLLLIALFLISAQGCASMYQKQSDLHLSAAYYNYLQDDFARYVEVTRQWLADHRNFISDDRGKELAMNSPFALNPANDTDKAVLLVHGLGDSPYYFKDVASLLQQQGFHVQVLLLPGHGSQPADLMLPSYGDWQNMVDHYASLLKRDYQEVWLGGFSTGANLVTIHAIEQGGIDGLLLFSPGFETHVPFIEKLAPLVASFVDWGWVAEETNIARYSSSPVRASISYSASATKVRNLLASHRVEIPTMIVISEADSVINPDAIKDYFDTRFTHPANTLIWYGEAEISGEKLIVKSMQLPELKISTGSHMGALFSPENSYFGQHGEKRMCRNGFDRSDRERCEQGEEVWFSAWGYSEPDKIFARLTWNPYFSEMSEILSRFVALD